MKNNFEIEKELVNWIRKAQWCKFYPYEIVIPDNEQFAVQIKTPMMLGGTQLDEIGTYLKAKNLYWLLEAGKGRKLIINIWQKPEDMIF